jgi:hypothetical protein
LKAEKERRDSQLQATQNGLSEDQENVAIINSLTPDSSDSELKVTLTAMDDLIDQALLDLETDSNEDSQPSVSRVPRFSQEQSKPKEDISQAISEYLPRSETQIENELSFLDDLEPDQFEMSEDIMKILPIKVKSKDKPTKDSSPKYLPKLKIDVKNSKIVPSNPVVPKFVIQHKNHYSPVQEETSSGSLKITKRRNSYTLTEAAVKKHNVSEKKARPTPKQSVFKSLKKSKELTPKQSSRINKRRKTIF